MARKIEKLRFEKEQLRAERDELKAKLESLTLTDYNHPLPYETITQADRILEGISQAIANNQHTKYHNDFPPLVSNTCYQSSHSDPSFFPEQPSTSGLKRVTSNSPIQPLQNNSQPAYAAVTMAFPLPRPSSPAEDDYLWCFKCKKYGHRTKQCPRSHTHPKSYENFDSKLSPEIKCKRCHRTGHLASDCNTGPPTRTPCRCGVYHWKYDCPHSQPTDRQSKH